MKHNTIHKKKQIEIEKNTDKKLVAILFVFNLLLKCMSFVDLFI